MQIFAGKYFTYRSFIWSAFGLYNYTNASRKNCRVFEDKYTHWKIVFVSINRNFDAKTYIERFILHLKTYKDITIEPCDLFILTDGTVAQCRDKEEFDGMVEPYDSYIDVVRQNGKTIS